MTKQEIEDCIRLMRAADQMLMDKQEYLVAAHLSMAIDMLLSRAAPTR